MPNPDQVRAAICTIAGGHATDSHRQTLTIFVAWEIYYRIRPPTNEKPAGDVYRWLLEHGYSDGQLKAWFFAGKCFGGLPERVTEYATLIATALEHGGCGCACLSHSHKARTEALKRCPASHLVNKKNLDAFLQTAPKRAANALNHWEAPTAADERDVRAHYCDVLTFVRRAVHGLTKLETGHRPFGQSMLPPVLETPAGSQLRIKPWESAAGKSTYRLYDTRSGVVGDWESRLVECSTCEIVASSPTAIRCGHPLTITLQHSSVRPEATFQIELARCLTCASHWAWGTAQKKCPICGGQRRRTTIHNAVAGPFQAGPASTSDDPPPDPSQDPFYQKQSDEPLPYDPDPDSDFDE